MFEIDRERDASRLTDRPMECYSGLIGAVNLDLRKS